MTIFNLKPNGDSTPFEVSGGGRFVFSRKNFIPAYVRAFEQGLLQQRATEAIEPLRSCKVCPRDQNRPVQQQDRRVQKRTAGARGQRFFAFRRGRLSAQLERVGHDLFRLVQFALRVLPEFLDQPIWRRGRSERGRACSDHLDLQRIGCHNVNSVTPEHVVPQILEALVIAVERSLRLPLVYNTSAYDSLESI